MALGLGAVKMKGLALLVRCSGLAVRALPPQAQERDRGGDAQRHCYL